MSTKIKGNDTITVSSRIFAQNVAHYLNLAKKENVAIKRGKAIIRLMHESADFENPSPSGDPYWNDPRKVEELRQIIKRRDDGLETPIPLTRELRKELLGI